MGLVSEFIESSSIVKELRKEIKEKDDKLKVLYRERDNCRNAERCFNEWVKAKEFAVKNNDGSVSCFVTVASNQELNGALQKHKALKNNDITIMATNRYPSDDWFVKVHSSDLAYVDFGYCNPYDDILSYPATLEAVPGSAEEFWKKSSQGEHIAYNLTLDRNVYCGDASRAAKVSIEFEKRFAYARARQF